MIPGIGRRPVAARHRASTARLVILVALATLTAAIAPRRATRRSPAALELLTSPSQVASQPARPAPWTRIGADQWTMVLLAVIVALAGLVAALAWEVRQGVAERAALQQAAWAEAQQAEARVRQAEALVTEQRAQLAERAATLAQQRREADALQLVLLAEVERQRALLEGQQQAMAVQGEDLRRQIGERQAEIDRLNGQIGEREADLARLNEQLNALQEQVAAAEDLAARLRRTLGIAAPSGPAGGDEPALLAAATTARAETVAEAEHRLADLDSRAASVTRELAALEEILNSRLNALRQMSASTPRVRLSAEAAAAAPTGLPVASAITSRYGPRLSPIDGEPRFHAGIDLLASIGTPVRATAAGQVVTAGASSSFGLLVVVRHAAGFETLYAHNSRLLVRPGQAVERGQVLALSGNTGASTGPHVHYEIHYQGTPIDPMPFAAAK